LSFPKKISKRKKRGVFALIFLIGVIILLPRIYGWYNEYNPIVVSVEELNRGVSELESKQFYSPRKKQYKKKRKYNTPSSRFNPNDYKQENWMALGLSEKQANVVLKFTSRGIYNNDQLKQIFVIDEELFELIKDSTFYPKKEWKNENKNDVQLPKQQIDINTATKEELLTLYGIGEYFSNKIIDYKNRLGGYTSKEQLLEIYNFDEEKLEKISDRIVVKTNNVKRININTCIADDLAKHPYIRWNVANSIVKMRTKHQQYTDWNQLLESELIDKVLLEKIKPYLSLD
jgi:competence protein ComEA